MKYVKRIALAAVIALVFVVVVKAVRRRIRGEKFYTMEDTVPVRSLVDGMLYRVHPEHANSTRAADILARTNISLTALMRHLKKLYIRDPQAEQKYPNRVRSVSRILRRFNPDNLAENSPLDPQGDTSYTLDKGALIALCLRERDPKLKSCLKAGCRGIDPRTMQLHDEKITLFVALHELAHVAVDVVDHPPIFWSTFKFLLKDAADAGVLQDADYDKHPTIYCGLNVDYTPLNDPNVPMLY